MQVLHDRCAALDVSKKDVKVCLRTPGRRRNQRTTVVRTFATTTNELLAMRDWLLAEKVSLVVMEATGDYWRSPYYLLEDALNVELINAKQAKAMPGRKTDLLTELRGGSRSSVRQLPVGGATFPGHDRRRGRRAGSVPAGGCATRVA